MNWKKWKIGLVIAILCGVFSAGAGLVAGMQWQAFVAVLCASLLTHLLTFLKNHPIENIEDTQHLKRAGKPGGTGPIACLTAALLCVAPGCAVFDGSLSDGDIALLGEDLRELSREGTIYALNENPEHRPHIELVQSKLAEQAASTNLLTIAGLRTTLQGLPIKELQTPEARLAVTGSSLVLRRVGRNVDLGNVSNIRPLAQGLADGMGDGLATVPPK